MKRYQITVDGRTFDIQVLDDPWQPQVEVEVDGERLILTVERMAVGEEPAVATPVPALSSVATPVPVAPASNIVAAPLPGVIKLIRVQPGQEVSASEPLLVIEAMKMDNVIRATRGGVIETIFVAEGHHVNHGEPMLEYQA
jgi:biotin carboxyl carrier protein